MSNFEYFKNCPINNENIYACIVKYYYIDWTGFITMLQETNMLDKSEVKELKEMP